MILCTTQCKYNVIKRAARASNYKLQDDDGQDWDLYWADTTIASLRIQKMQAYQRINHFLGMASLSHKHNLAKNLKKM